jgi:cytochrome c oxidase subunit 4
MAAPTALPPESHTLPEEHHASPVRYLVVWLALLALTAATFGASRFELGRFHLLVALGIAVIKSALVVLFFMHLSEQRGAARIAFVTSLVFVALLIGFTVADVGTRFSLANPPTSPVSGESSGGAAPP